MNLSGFSHSGRAEPSSPPLLAQGRAFRLLMTVDAVGGVWRYAMELAASLADRGIEVVFAGFGPEPSRQQRAEAEEIGRLAWFDAPLDWTARDEKEVEAVPALIARAAREYAVDLLHLNLPSQAAGLPTDLPAVVVSHSCVATWFQRMRPDEGLPEPFRWQKRHNRQGFDRAAAVVAPSASHAADVVHCYGPVDNLHVVHNAIADTALETERQDFVFAAARWWDEAKNGKTLDAAAALCAWPVLMAGDTEGPNGQRLAIENARHEGALSYCDAMGLMRQAGLFASPSLYEPFGLAALEAALSGAALVLADIPTYRELWDGAALFADPRDPADFARAMDRLAGDRAMRLDFAARARERATGYSPSRQAAAMLSLYERVLAPDHSRSRKEF